MSLTNYYYSALASLNYFSRALTLSVTAFKSANLTANSFSAVFNASVNYETKAFFSYIYLLTSVKLATAVTHLQIEAAATDYYATNFGSKSGLDAIFFLIATSTLVEML